ncbi:type I secretion system permease/ATPase [Rhodospirillum centenum]|uniref:Proteases secretion ATP-binding protein PrtD n=1 Tax=Rhodospirillum centenum (strain ATCC 51521 / SW) TaxID=414684 RepID=B6IQR5_RHOCS|nr:type I secretion system permease/ATPase [Rhodospirillum centenum]ACI97801.1 proteases secretion ATP-binding protein PrtD [Rhodospirillum centenum SW]
MRTKPKTELTLALKACGGGFAMAGVFSFFINMLMLVSPLYMLQVYDRVLGSRSEATLLMLTIVIIGLLGVMGALELLRSRVLVRISNRIDTRLAERLFEIVYERALRMPQASRSQPLSDLLTLRQFLTGQGLFAFFDAPWAPLYMLVVFLLHPLLGIIAVCGAVILVALAVATEMLTRKPLAQANQEQMLGGQFAETNLRNAEVLEAMGMLPGIRRRWYDRHRKMLTLQAVASDRAGAISSITKFVRISLQSLILGAGAWLAIRHEITPGVMIAASIIVGRALAPVEQAIGTWKLLLQARSSYERLTEMFQKVPPRPQPMPLPAPTGALAVEGLVAVPPGSTVPALRGISFQVEAGEAVGIIGPSAAGKSTLVRMLVGVWPAYAGKIRLDGADIGQWDRTQLGPHIGYLPQDVELFSGTIAENIARFGEVDADKVVTAARMAGVHDLIVRLPQGYDTQIGEGGSVLSGGQRQRVALARALYGDPVLVILDEPNSNLDDEGEAALVRAMAQLRDRGATVLIVAHRPSVLGGVDKILVLRDGAVQMFGPRADVMARFARPATAVQTENVTQLKSGVA